MVEALIDWQVKEGSLTPHLLLSDGTKQQVGWTPQPGSQEAFLACPAFECLYEGTRGPGKTDALLMDFAQHVGAGYGAEWRGLLFRQTFPQLQDVIIKASKWFPLLFNRRAVYNQGNHTWTWASGETLRFSYGAREADYWNYHGHCVDEGDVLTDHGWVDITCVRVGDKVMSADERGFLSWKPVVSITHELYDGPLVRYAGRGRYMSFTPGHKLPTSTGLTRYQDLGKDAVLRVAGWQWGGTYLKTFAVPFVPRAVRDHHAESIPLEISGDDFCELMGWYLSEGCINYAAVWVAQEKPQHRLKIQALLDRIGVSYRTTAGGFSFLSKSWSTWLRQFGKSRDKFVPDVVKNADRYQLQKFFDAYADGDGSRQEKRVYIYTISRRMADDLSEIAVRLGYSAYITSGQRENRDGPGYCVACNPRSLLNLVTDNRDRRIKKLSDKTQVHRVHHSGLVYCLGVPDNHTFFIRQRGSVWLSGNSWPWIGFEELTTWPELGFYCKMMSCCRSTVPGIPKKFRSTTNPYGPGHNVVKARFHLPVAPGQIYGPLVEDRDEKGNPLPERIAIHGYLDENQVLLTADPNYKTRIRAAARNKAELAAWMEGSWDIVAGGMFDDVWDPARHVVPDFEPPISWRVDRSFDWGSSKPFSVGWWAESDGTDLTLPSGQVCSTVRGDLFRLAEWYGWNGQPNEGTHMLAVDIAKGIIERELAMGIHERCRPGPADASVFKMENGVCIANDLMRTLTVGGRPRRIQFCSSNSASGTRKVGWELMRQRLMAALPTSKGPREDPGMFICQRCEHSRRTVPVLPRDLDRDPDDVDSSAEDHIADESRYRVMFSKWRPKGGRTVGTGS